MKQLKKKGSNNISFILKASNYPVFHSGLNMLTTS